MARPALLAALLLLSAPASAQLVLAPGQPFTATSAELLLAPHATAEHGIEVLAPVLPLNNRSTKPVHLSVASFHHDPATGGFSAEIVVAVEDGPTNAMRLNGRTAAMIELPVPIATAPAGAVLAASDLTTARLRATAIPQDAVLDAGAIVGAQAVRRLPAGRPIRPADLREPLLVRKGEVVSLVLSSRGLHLGTLGRALEDGVMDAPVRVLNLDSGREIRGVVGDRKLVVVPLRSRTP